ncbi:hypothetical protein B5F39_12080 [Cloacibacillus sp. An23]|nr:hypothetical protein B5F39_12080 [Cloacibacillus sp. An23]
MEMTDVIGLQEEISRNLNTQIEIENRGIDAFQVFTPFVLGDGDELKIILKRTGDTWRLTDEGHTLMYLSYQDIGLENNTRAEVMDRILKSHFMKDEDGRLVLDGIRTPQDIVDSIFTFSQGLLKIGDISMWKIERAKSKYTENFKSCITEGVKGRCVMFSYQSVEYDPGGMYPIDCCVRLRTGRPAYIFSATSTDKANWTAAAIYFFEKKQPYVPSCAVLQGKISGKPLLRLEDAADKVFQTPQNAAERLDTFLLKYENAA